MPANTKIEERAATFRALHEAAEIFLLPNAWDVTSALVLEQAGFSAIATTSAGVGYSFGYPIGQKMPLTDMLAVLSRITERVACPFSADMEVGYGRHTGRGRGNSAPNLADRHRRHQSGRPDL